MIPRVDVTGLLGSPGAARDDADAALMSAAETTGFLTITGPSAHIPDAATRAELLRVFELSDDDVRPLARAAYEPTHANVYRGWNPRGGGSTADIYDLGPDVAGVGADEGTPARPSAQADDPLLEPTPLPAEVQLPGWRAAVAAYYRSMQVLGEALMRSIARSMGLPESHFDEPFDSGISTLRLMRYTQPDDGLAPARRGEHVDSGFVTLLAQHGVEGLQAQMRSGEWVDVAPSPDALAVNFGALLERWTSGRIRATPHRVVSAAPTRCSIPFFYEPRPDAVIRTLPLPDAPVIEPFSYGDHLWSAMVAFPNFRSLAGRRTPRGVPGNTAANTAAR